MKQGLIIDHNDHGIVLITFDKAYQGLVLPYKEAALLAMDLMNHAKAAQEEEKKIVLIN